MEKIENQPIHSQIESEGTEISLTGLYREMRTKWQWYVISIGIFLIIGVLYLLSATPKYSRTTEILLKDDTSQSFAADLSMFGVNPVPSEILNEIFVMTSPEIMQQVVEQLDLNNVYTTRRGLRKVELYKTSPVVVTPISTPDTVSAIKFTIKVNHDTTGVVLSKFYRAGKKVSGGNVSVPFGSEAVTPVGTFRIDETKFMHQAAQPELSIPGKVTYTHTPVKKSAQNFCKLLSSNFDEDRGNIVMLTITATSIKKASDILTAIVEAYNRRWVSDKNNIALATSRFIDERLVSIEQELGDVESNITEFKSNHRLMDMESMATLYLTQSSENQKALSQIAQEIAIGRYLKKELSEGDITNLLPVTAEIGGTSIQQMVAEYNKAVTERNIRLETMPEDSPLMRQKAEVINQTRQAIIASVDAALESLNKRYNAIALEDNSTQSKLATAPGQAKYLMSEERKQKVKESLYLFLLQRREENELNQAFNAINTRMVTEPFGEDTPTSPNSKLILLIALVLGVLAPTLIIYLREVTNTKVRSRRDIEDLLIPFLGEVPLTDAPRKKWYKKTAKNEPSGARKIIVRPHTGDITNEAFRMIRTNIDFMGSMNHRQEVSHGRTIMVVSLNAGAGKTFTALNTAASYAIKNKKTCLVDLDLRKGTVSQNVNSPQKGLVDYLVGKNTNLDDLIVRNVDGIENLDILPEGLMPPNPTELLYSPNLEVLIDELRERYDYIIFDCPPIEVVADARLLNPYVDMTIFVMRSGLFEKCDLKVLRNMYDSRRYNNLAIILNATDTVHGVYGSYGYGYGYYQRRHKKDKRKK